MERRPQVLLFDLGGVLVEFSGVRDVAPLMSTPISEQEIRARWSTCPHTEAYCRGALTRREFSEQFVTAWGLSLTPDAFAEQFRSWSRRALPGAAELMALLRKQYRLAALSNSNELHWDRNTRELGVTGWFDVAISSHQVGINKPDPAIYAFALERLATRAQDVVFFDDVLDNVEAARRLGIRAFHVIGVEGLRARLHQEHIL